MAKMQADLDLNNERYNKKLDQSKKKTKEFGNEVGNSAKKVKVNATPALTDLSRTIQDMPYGIQGVANNIQQLTAQMGYLAQQTNSATGKAMGYKGALGAMVGAIAGPAGILFAISAITSLWVTYEDELKAAIGTTDLIGDAIAEASESIGENINQLTSLTNAYADSNTGPADKKKILEELASEYPKYFGDMDTEKATLGEVKKAYDLQKEAIMGMGLVKALEAKKAPIYAKQAEMLLKTEIGWWDKLKIAIGTTAAATGGAGAILGGLAGGDTLGELENELKEIDKLIDQQMKRFNLEDTDLIADTLKSGKKDKKKRRERVAVLTGLPTGDEVLKLGAEGKKAWRQIQEEYSTEFEPLTFTANEEEQAEALLKQRDGMAEHYKLLEEQAAQFNANMENIVGSNLSSTFGQIGEVIGTALVEGGDILGALGGTLLQGLSNFLSDMGGLLIEYGTLGVIKGKLDTAIAAGGPVAIAAGFAAIGVGIALKAAGAALASKAQSGFGGGGGGTSPVGAGSNGGFSSRSSQTSSFNGGGGGTVVFKIAGTDLIGVLNRGLQRNKALGGNLALG